MNEIKIKLNDKNQMTLTTKKPIHFEDMLQITQTALLSHANTILKNVPEEDLEAVKGSLYDKMNLAFSRTLEFFAPEFEVNPGLTAQAILEAENAIIERQYQEYLKKKKGFNGPNKSNS